ncbi:MAG: hypothetical protein CHACPFDD_01579 [Phycisphaerae bacterium]|nr:hypothetical protein [Phycisphaerae bacterium]
MRGILILLAGLSAAAAGCAESTEVVTYESRVMVAVAPQEAFDGAVTIFRREFGRVSADRDALTIDVPPSEYVVTRDTGSARDLVGGPTTVRRSARLRIRPSGDGSVAEVRVDLERRETTTSLSPANDSRLGDRPGYTPIERDAATTDRQNTVWSRVRRDRALERSLLNELREWALSRAAPGGSESTGSAP